MDGISSIQSGTFYSYQSQKSSSSSTTTDFQSIMEDRMKQMEEDVESGKIDVDDLKEKLQNRFGDAVSDAFNEDGSIDYDKLQQVIQDQMETQQGNMAPPPGPPPGPPPDETDSTTDSTSTDDDSSTFKIDSSSLQQKLIDDFGDEADGIVSDDGTINFDKLKELLDSKLGTQTNSTSTAYSNQAFNMNSLLFPTGSLFSVKA